jgi:hypothetical protein
MLPPPGSGCRLDEEVTLMDPSPAAPPPPPVEAARAPAARRSVPVGWLALLVLGAIISVVALAPLIGGGFLLWAHATQRDDDGYFTTSSERLETTSYAITSEDIDLGADPGEDGVDLGDIATLRVDITGTGEPATFVGIGPKEDIDRYLDGVGRAEVDDISFDPFAVTYRYQEGDGPATLPGDADFWVASATGTDPQRLVWEPEAGTWALVIMNADGSPGVSVDAAVGADTPWVFRIGVALVVGAGLGLLIGATMLVVGVVGLSRGTYIDLVGTGVHHGPPIRIEGRLDEPLNRWLWLVKWALLIPHLIVLAVLWVAFSVVTFFAFFAILFTGRYPRSLFAFNVGVLRWTWRVVYYGYGALGTDRYPPFSMGPEPDYPATLSVAYPEHLSRGLVLVKWWLLAIPQYLVLTLITGGALAGFGGEWAVAVPFGGLIGLLVLFAAVALAFVGQYPTGIFQLVMGLNRWVYRVIAYVALMTDEYPPFRLDQGGGEPEPESRPPERPPPTRAEPVDESALV